jgi:hypothetical protein
VTVGRILLACLLAAQCFGQQTGAATTRGTCSPATTGNNNTFTFNCGIGKEQGEAMLSIVNRILVHQIDPSAVMAKLDEIQRGVDELRERAAHRIIRDNDAAALSKFLSEFPKQAVTMTFLASNEEARQLAVKLRSIVLAAGWDCKVPNPSMVFATGPLPGIQINAQKDNKAAVALLNALHQIGLSIEGVARPQLEQNVIAIHVHSKP